MLGCCVEFMIEYMWFEQYVWVFCLIEFVVRCFNFDDGVQGIFVGVDDVGGVCYVDICQVFGCVFEFCWDYFVFFGCEKVCVRWVWFFVNVSEIFLR